MSFYKTIYEVQILEPQKVRRCLDFFGSKVLLYNSARLFILWMYFLNIFTCTLTWKKEC